jgi:hypothetical protein
MALSAQPYGKVMDYEQYIDHQIGRTRARIRATDIATASLTLVAAILGVLFLEVVFDHTIGLPIWLRRILLFFEVVGCCAYAGFRIVRPLFSRVNSFYAAKTIESSEPNFKNSLLNYLDLRKKREQLPKHALAAIERKAVGDLTKVEIDAVVNQRRFMQTAYVLSAIVVIFCLYALLTPKSIWDSTRRALLADVVRPTNTQFFSVKPGDDPERSKVVAGTHVTFTTEVRGTIPDKVRLHYSFDGGQYFAVAELVPGAKYAPWQTTLRNLQQSVDYYLTGGDAESRRYHVEVLPAPMVTGVELDLEFPEYTSTPARMNIEGGNIEAI